MSDHILALITTQVWQITALAIVVAVVVKLAAKNRPHLAHALWVLVLIKCVTPPLWGHSLGVFSQLQARLMPDEPATLPDVSESPASVPVAIAEALVPAPEIDVPNPQHGQPETFEPDELLSIADTEPPEDASLMWDGGTGFELDEAAQTLDNQEANFTYAEPALPVKRFLLSGLVAGAVLTLFVMVIRCLRCLREIHRHRTTEFDVQLRERIQHLSRQLRIRRIPQIIVSDVLFGPAVLGLLRHTIVLPRCLFEIAEGSQGRSFLPERTVFGRSFLPERTFAVRRTAQGATSAPRQSIVIESISSGRVAAGREVLPGREDQHYLDPILAHELLHIRRGDLRTGTLQAIVQSLWWFHPAVWLSNRWLSREAERCCDEQVIAELGCSPARYARSLLSVIECKHQLQPIPVFPGMKPVEITTQRMERIMSLKNGLKKRTPLWCWLTVVGLAFVVLPGAIAQRSSDESLSWQAAALRGLTITNNGETEAVLVVLEAGLATEQEIAKTGVNNDPGLVGTARSDQPSNVAGRPGRSPATSEIQDNVAGRDDGPPTPERIRRPKLEASDKLLVPERPMPPEIQQSSDPLVKLVWEARESSRRRLLTTDEHTPWQLMHGLLGLRQDFVVKHNGRIINGLEWIQSGPTFKDEPPFQEDQPWFQKTKYGGRAHPYLRPYLFEGHISQFAAILASCRLPLNAQFGTPDGPITMQDLITNAQMTANEKEEVSWTLSALSRYLPPDANWVNGKGEEWSIERLVKVEVGKTLDGPCGGTCGLIALAVARNEYQRSGKPVEGVWLEAEQKVRRYMQTARMQQNPNGTLSSKYFRGREYNQGFDERLTSSGALLQFLMMAASDEQLKEDWLRRAVEATANDLMDNRKASVSCAPLFETTNALSIYLDRVSVSAVAAVKPDSKEVSLAEPLFLCSYPVADLVVLQQSVMAAVSRSTDNGNLTTRAVVPAAAVAEASHDSADRAIPQPLPEAQDSTAMPLSDKADFAPLTELIKATVQPESWDARRTIAVEEKLLSLVIRQTEAAHGEIADLLSQLRNAQDQNVRIQCLLLQLTEESQKQRVREKCSLHPAESDRQWALLPPQRSQALTQTLLELKPEVLQRPQVMTISGQTATIQIGSIVAGENAATGIRLAMTPHLLPDSKVIRMQHSFLVGGFANEMPKPIESLVGSGQTLLLLIDDPEDRENPDAARSQYLLMMTPVHIPQKEEEWDVSGGASEDSAFAVDPADSPVK